MLTFAPRTVDFRSPGLARHVQDIPRAELMVGGGTPSPGGCRLSAEASGVDGDGDEYVLRVGLGPPAVSAAAHAVAVGELSDGALNVDGAAHGLGGIAFGKVQ
ncbi:hypothetical protein [Streptomyces sp. NBC_01451]|uniref:hypothetical protein n=1 Tax=Streptomyces sp. NBC_01451 TaxID=2903872 RepID=UPI002E32C205|nr:hypothetical protein [Streptomyces sp. NBC_01451]